jgi:hypothetical protein
MPLAISGPNEAFTMSRELRFPDDNIDPLIADALEPLLTPPSDDSAYWDGLHRRVMARISSVGTPSTWWAVSPAMARAGLIAAGLALLALGALAVQTSENETRMAYQAVTETELEVARIIPGVDEQPIGTQASRPQTPPSSR